MDKHAQQTLLKRLELCEESLYGSTLSHPRAETIFVIARHKR